MGPRNQIFGSTSLVKVFPLWPLYPFTELMEDSSSSGMIPARIEHFCPNSHLGQYELFVPFPNELAQAGEQNWIGHSFKPSLGCPTSALNPRLIIEWS